MKIAGIILLVLQVLALIGGAPVLAGGGVYAIGTLLGFFLPGIIGVILLVKGIKKEKEKQQDSE